MKKNLHFMIAALLMMFGTTAMAQEVTLDFTTNDEWKIPTDYVTEAASYTNADKYTIIINAPNGHKYNEKDHYLIWGKADATLTLPAFGFDVERIDVTGREGASGNTKQNIYVGDEPVSGETTGATGKNSYVIAEAYQGAGNVYVLKIISTHNSQITKIEIFKKGEASVIAPTFTPNGGDFEESVNVTISAGEGATIYYALGEADFNVYSAPFTLTETTTVKAYAEQNGKQSETVSATFTKVAAPEVQVATIAEFNAAEVNNNVWYQLTGTVKNLVDGDQYGNFDIEDETGSVYVYGLLSEKGGPKKQFQALAAEKGIQNGSVLTLIGTRGVYNEKIEVLNADFVSVDNSGVGPIDPVELEGDGTKDNPYTVADVKAIKEFPADKVWVKGFIVGSIKNNAIEEVPSQVSNIAIAAEAGITEWESVVPVQLPANTEVRTSLNVVDNPDNIGKAVKLFGNIATYFSTNGLKEVSEFEMESSTAISSVQTNAKQGVVYNLQGQQVMQPTKGLYIINGKKVVIK